MNLLIVKLSAIGDVVLTLPFVEALRKAYPDARLTWLVEEAAADVVMGLPQVDRVLVSRRKAWIRDIKKGRIFSTARKMAGFLRELRQERYDAVIDLQGLFKSAIFTYLTGSRRRIGFDRSREFSHLFYNRRLAPYPRNQHAYLRNLDAAASLGAEIESYKRSGSPIRLPQDPDAAEKARSLLNGLTGTRVVINSSARWETKCWPMAYWRDLVGRLARDPAVDVILTGAPSDRDLSREVKGDTDRVLDLTGQTSLRELAEVFRTADLVVSSDTGPMHLAASTGTAVLALFGPTAPWRSGPYGPNHRVLWQGLKCAPCFKKTCPDPVCMTGLSVEAVHAAVREALPWCDAERFQH